MIEFVNTLCVRPLFLTEERTYTFDTDSFTFEPTSSDEDGGMLYNCDHVFVIDTPDKDTITFFSQPRTSIVTLKDSHQRPYHVGTEDLPARVYLQPHLNKTRLYISCKMLSNPLI